jgi:hypothetical protein
MSAEYRSLPHTLRRLFDVYDNHGIKAPKVAAELTRLIDVATRADAARFNTEPLEHVVTAAISDGRDPLTDPDVTRAIIARELANLAGTGALGRVARNNLAATTRASVDDLIAPLKPVFAQVGQQYAEAHATLTAAGINSTKDAALSTASLPLAAAGVQARQAEATLHGIAQAVGSLLVELGMSDPTPVGSRVRYIDPGNADTTALLRHLTGALDPWAVAANGWTFDLATTTETAERHAHVNENDHHAAAREAAAARADRVSYI